MNRPETAPEKATPKADEKVAAQVCASLRSDRGTNPVSVLFVLMLVLLIFEIVAVSGRLVAAQANVNLAAREAARSGTLVQNVYEVEPAVDGAANANLANGDLSLIHI